MAAPAKAVSTATPETRPFWDGTEAGELRLQRCRDCDAHYFPPRPVCPRCDGNEVTGTYGMFAIQESVRQLRGTAAAQVDGAEISVAQGVGGMLMSAGTLVLGRERR